MRTDELRSAVKATEKAGWRWPLRPGARVKGHRLDRRRRPGRIVLDRPTFRRWEALQEPGRRSVWEHDGHRFEVIKRLPVPPELKGVVFLLAMPLEVGPNPGRSA